VDLVKKKTSYPERFNVYLVNLDPTVGSKIQKTRPCVVISPDEMNRHPRTVIIAPITSTLCSYPSRIPVAFKGKQAHIALDQIRTVDKERLVTHWGLIVQETANHLCHTPLEMFIL